MEKKSSNLSFYVCGKRSERELLPGAAPASIAAPASSVAAPGAASPASSKSSADGLLHAGTLSPSLRLLRIDVSEHGGVLEHVWKDHEADLAASDVDLLEIRHAAISRRVLDVGHLAVHVVLSVAQLTSIDLPRLQLDCHRVALRLMENFDGDADTHSSPSLADG